MYGRYAVQLGTTRGNSAVDAVYTSRHEFMRWRMASQQWVRVEGKSPSCRTCQCESRPDLFIEMNDKVPEFMFTYKASAEGQSRRFVPSSV